MIEIEIEAKIRTTLPVFEDEPDRIEECIEYFCASHKIKRKDVKIIGRKKK